MNLQAILNDIANSIKPDFGKGKVANYIPALARVKPKQFGMAVYTNEGALYSTGAANAPFSIQSISKVLTLCIAIQENDDSLWQRVGREPSGNPFNSLVQLESENGIPRNPLINAGAHVVTDAIMSKHENVNDYILEFARKRAETEEIHYDEEVALSEKQTGYRNAALCYFLRSFNNIKNDVEAVLDAYYHQCSITMNCIQLARAFHFLANAGTDISGDIVLTLSKTKRVNAIMQTCGLYDAVGEFAYQVGLPAKSGVSGAIVAVLPGKLSISVWSPELDPAGNSYIGTKALAMFTSKTGLSIF